MEDKLLEYTTSLNEKVENTSLVEPSQHGSVHKSEATKDDEHDEQGHRVCPLGYSSLNRRSKGVALYNLGVVNH